MKFCLNLSFGDNQRLVNDFSETNVINLLQAYFPGNNPTYNEFISNDSVKKALGLMSKSKANTELGSSFKKEISADQVTRLRTKISQVNNRLKREGVDFVYMMHNFRRVGQADLYTWDVRKVNGTLDVDAKLQRAKDRRDLAFQKSKVVDDLEKMKIEDGDTTPIDLFTQLEKNPSDEVAESINRQMDALSELGTDESIIEEEVVTSKIKSGVQELFDSNPELANQVYETLGFDISQLKEDIAVTNAFLTARQHEEAKRINSGEFDDTKLDLKEELQNIIDNSSNPLLVELAKSIQNKESLKSIKAFSTQKPFKTNEGFEPAAAYQAETQRLILFLGNTARFENKEREYQYLLHELVHHFVDRELVLTNSEQAENIRQLFKYTKYQLTKAGKENLYGLTNFHEFVTEALTNPDFQKELKNLQVPEQFFTKSFSLFDYFLELISKVLGTNKSVLEAVVFQAADIFELQEYKKSLSITPQQKQQALQQYSQYLEQNPNGDIEGFKKFLGKETQGIQGILFNLSEKSEQLNKMPTDQWFNTAIVPIIARFSEMFPTIKSKIISEKDVPAEVAEKVANLGKQINSFYHNGEVYIIKERVSKSATVEEFLHPFINALEVENKALYNSLLKEAKELFPELKEQLFKTYEGVYSSVLDMNREFLTQALTQKVSGVKETSLYQKFIEALKKLINRLLKGNAQKYYNIELADLDANMSINELAAILNTTDKKFNFNPDTGTTYYSLNAREVEAYQNAPKTTIQKGMVDKVLDNNNLIYQTPERPFYYDSLNGITVDLKPAYEFAPKKNYPNVDMKNFLNIANHVHDIVNELNVSVTENKKDFINDLAEKSELTEFLNTRGFDGKKVVKDILDPIYDYVNFLKKQNKSIVMSQVAVGNFVDNVADSIELLEITKDGNVVIHKIKTIFTGPTDVQNLGKEGTLTKKLESLKKGFETEASIDSKLVKGLFGKDTKVSLQLVPIMITALSKENFEGATDVKEIVPSKYGSTGIVYFPIESVEEDQKRFKLNYLEGIASRVIKSVPKEEKAKVVSQEEIDKQKVIDKLTEEQKGENSEKLNLEIQRVYKRIYETVKQYGSSSDEVRAELYKIFDPSKQQDYKAIESSLDVIFNRLKEIADQEASLDPTNPDTELEALKLKEEKVKQYLSTVIQYINFVQETSLGMENLKANFQDVLSKKNEMSEYELLDRMRKIYMFSKSYKADLESIADQLQDIEDSNMFKKMNQNALNIINKIERDYYDNSLPIVAKILNSQFTEEYKSRVTNELNLKLAAKEERLNDVQNYPIGSARRKYLEKEIAGIKNEIAKLPSESIIQATIEGKLGDSSYFYTNMMANINNPDYVISASANILERVMIDLRLAMIPKQDAFSTELSKRLDVFGTSPDKVKELNESLTYIVNKIIRKSDGTVEEWQQLHLITDVDENVYYEHDKLKLALQQLIDNNGTKAEIEAASIALKQFERDNFEDKYNSEYMAVLNSIDVYLPDGTNPKLMVEAIFDRIKQVKSKYSSKNFMQGKNVTPEDMTEIREAWRDYNNLFSELDRDGNPKTGSQLEATRLLVAKRDALRNFSTVELNYDLFNKFRTQLLNDLIAEYGSEEEALKSDEYKEWAAYNVKTVLTQEFLDKRQSLIDEMTSILDKYKDENAQKAKSDIWKKIFNLLQGYRDNDNNYVPSELSEATKEKVRNLETQLSELDVEIKRNRGKLAKEDAGRLSIIMEELQGLQTYVETPYYLEDYENALAKFAAKINSTPEQIKQSPNLFAQFKNEDWYRNSHVVVQKYNNFLGGYEDVEIPAYFYRTVVPTDPKYIEEQPASQYKVNIVDDQYLNPDYLDNFGRRQVRLYKPGAINSIYRNPLHYEKIMVGSSEKDRVNRENLAFLKQQMDETQKGLHRANMIEYAIPTAMKTTWDRAMEGDFKGFWENFKASLQRTEQETEYKTVLTDMTGEETKFIPVLFKNKIELDNQSYDVFGNILKYQMSATKSKMLDQKLSTFQVLQDLLEKFPITQGENVIDQITNKLNKKYGWTLPTGVIGKGELRKEAIRDLVNRIFYEEYKEDLFTIPFLNISDGKAADILLGYAGTNIMMLNFPNWIVNFFSGNIQLMVEAASGRNLSKEDLAAAKVELAKQTPDIIRDMGKLGNKSLYGQLLDFFDPMKGEFIDEFGNKASWSVRRNLKSILFSGKIFGEWEMQNTAFIGMLKAKKVRKIDPKFQEQFDALKEQLRLAKTETDKKDIEDRMDAMSDTISLYDAFERGPKGIPLIKEGVQTNIEELKDYMQKIQGVNKALNGSYAKLDQLKWEKYSVGRLAIFMKKFFFPLLVNRLGGFRGDLELKDVREGYYRTFMNTVLKDLFIYRIGIPAIIANYKDGKYTPLQKEGIRKTFMDIAIISSLIVLLVALGYYDDEEETDGVKMAQYLLLKINRESLTFSPAIGLQESYSMFKSPFALMGYVGNLGKLLEMTVKYPLNLTFGAFEDDLYYQKKTALWQKGDSKFAAALLKLGGLKINHTDPDELLKSYQLQTGW